MAPTKHARPRSNRAAVLAAVGFVAAMALVLGGVFFLFGRSGSAGSASPTSTAAGTAPAQSSQSTSTDGAPPPSYPRGGVTSPLPLQYQTSETTTTGFPAQYAPKVKDLAKAYMSAYLTVHGTAARTTALTPLATKGNVATNALVSAENLPTVTVKGDPVIQQDVSAALGVPVLEVTWSDNTRVYLVMASAPESKYGWQVSLLLDQTTYKQTIIPQASSAAASASSNVQQGS